MDKFVTKTKRKVEGNDPETSSSKKIKSGGSAEYGDKGRSDQIVSQDPNSQEKLAQPQKPLGAWLVPNPNLKWKKVKALDLDLDYCIFFNKTQADRLLHLLENELEYNTGQLAKVHIFGKWMDIPRKQVE